MPTITRTDFKKTKKTIPVGIKLALLIAFGFGIWFKTCYKDYQKENITFEKIRLENPTNMSVDVYFTINNPTYQNGKKNVFIQVITSYNDILATKLTTIQLDAKSKQEYIKVIDKFKRPLATDEKIVKATVEFY